ncbi:hypothetical protein G6F68_012956 [Rhizopus microsporus]|nr:hypothetical protein G6F32_015207 [Rhizopus arrhizus]KAG1250146.1 hypothetical protein G6F68_012956 [Rhizopus microsporus]
MNLLAASGAIQLNGLRTLPVGAYGGRRESDLDAVFHHPGPGRAPGAGVGACADFEVAAAEQPGQRIHLADARYAADAPDAVHLLRAAVRAGGGRAPARFSGGRRGVCAELRGAARCWA